MCLTCLGFARQQFAGSGQELTGYLTGRPANAQDRRKPQTLQVPSAAPPRGTVQRGLRSGHAVVAAATVPDGAPPQPLPAAVAALFPAACGSATAAKRAVRRGELLVDGVQRGVAWCGPRAPALLGVRQEEPPLPMRGALVSMASPAM